MKIRVTGKNVDVSDNLKDTIDKRLGKLDRYFTRPIAEANVILSLDKYRHIAEVTLFVAGVTLRGEVTSEDMYVSVEGAIDKIEKQILRNKSQLEKKWRGAGFTPSAVEGLQPSQDEEEDTLPKVVRMKRFAIKPTSIEEAVLQMQLLGHDFYVFRNAQSDEVSVLYKRRDGNLGLIEPSDEEDEGE